MYYSLGKRKQISEYAPSLLSVVKHLTQRTKKGFCVSRVSLNKSPGVSSKLRTPYDSTFHLTHRQQLGLVIPWVTYVASTLSSSPPSMCFHVAPLSANRRLKQKIQLTTQLFPQPWFFLQSSRTVLQMSRALTALSMREQVDKSTPIYILWAHGSSYKTSFWFLTSSLGSSPLLALSANCHGTAAAVSPSTEAKHLFQAISRFPLTGHSIFHLTRFIGASAEEGSLKTML